MKTRNKALLLTALLAASMAAQADRRDYYDGEFYQDRFDQDVFYDKAKVVSATPYYETVAIEVPQEHCRVEQRSRYRGSEGAYVAPVIGGIVGGVLGNQVGQGNGKTAATIAGAILGAGAGQRFYRNHSTSGYSGGRQRHCETVMRYEERSQVAGYDVKYKYKGGIYTTRTDQHPGKHITVRVDVDPMFDSDRYTYY